MKSVRSCQPPPWAIEPLSRIAKSGDTWVPTLTSPQPWAKAPKPPTVALPHVVPPVWERVKTWTMPGERRGAVQRALGAADDLDPVDVVDRNHREIGVERPADRHAVEGDHEGVEFLDAVDPDVRQARTVVGAVACVDADDVLQGVGEGAGPPAAQLLAADDADRVGDLEDLFGDLRGRNDDVLFERGVRGRRRPRGRRGRGGRSRGLAAQRGDRAEDDGCPRAGEPARNAPVHGLLLRVSFETKPR